MTKEYLQTCIKELSFEEAKSTLQDYKYLLIYEISQTRLEKVEEVPEISWNKCKELYAFGGGNQLHIFFDEEDEEWKCVEFRPVNLNYVEKEYYLASRYANKERNTVVVREYLCADQDGQTYVGYTALQNLVKGGAKDE